MTLRKGLALLLALALALSLCACGASVEDELTRQTEAMFQDIRNIDAESLDKWTGASGEALDELMEAVSEMGAEDMLDGVMDVLLTYLQDCAAQMTYKIAEVDTENLTVDVKCSYVDSSGFWQCYVENVLSYTMEHLWDEDAMGDEAVAQLFRDSLDQVQTETQTAVVTVYFEKNDKGYEVLRTSDELLDVVTAGLFSGLDDLEEILSGALENADFSGLAEGGSELPYEVTETPMGLLVMVYNNTGAQVEPWVEITYYDAQGGELSYDSNYLDVLPAGAAGLIPLLNYEGLEYASYEITASGYDGSYSYDLTSYIDAEFADGDSSVEVTLTNTSDVTAAAVDVMVVYSKGGTPVGFGTDYITDLASGASVAAYCAHPYDPASYEDLAYDSYDVYAVSYSFDEPTGTVTPASSGSTGMEKEASALVKAVLDVIYLDQYSEESLSMLGFTVEEAEDTYENGLEVETEYFASYFDIDLEVCGDEIEDQIEDLYRQIYTHSRYEVGEAVWNGSYQVQVTVYPIDVIRKVVDEDGERFDADWQARADAGEFDGMSDREFETAWARAVIGAVSARLEGVGYLDAQTVTVGLSLDASGRYELEESFGNVDQWVIQY